MLEVRGLQVAYGAIQAVRDVSLTLAEGETVALLGANGAGKTSTLMCIAGALPAAGGSVRLEGADVTSARPEVMARKGVATVPETRDVFPDLTVDENLQLGAYTRRRNTQGVAEDRARMFEMFPVLAERCRQPAGTLSGGEQQMLVIARAMMSRPRILLLDEPSLGLAPGLTILLVEQNASKALAVADRAYVMRLGRIAAEGTAAEIAAATDLKTLYLAG
jgi:branched-chain amino acid transport system ATP-binding protein